MAKMFTEKINPLELKRDAIKDAEIRFDELVASGTIKLECHFEDNVWKATDEYSNVGLYFKFNNESYDNYYRDLFGIELCDFIYYLKCYILSIFGKNALATIASILLDVRHIIDNDIEEFLSMSDDISISLPDATSDFFVLLPTQCDMDPIVKSFDRYADKLYRMKIESKRVLADMDSYFLFDEIIHDFWASDLPDSTRIFYYPLYLWWITTVVIPTRPREFILTERDCLSIGANGEYYLRLRKSKLKGSNRKKSYNITDDYEIKVFKVPDYVGQEFERYIMLTEEYAPNELDTLFVSDPHFQKWNQKKHSNSRFLSYMNLRTIMRYFYFEVLHDVYGLEIYYRYEEEHLRQGDICYIQLGDTRHLALINVMQQGGTPALSMFLAGHENPNQAMHYASNFLTVSKCKTYRRHLKLMGGVTDIDIRKPINPPSRSEGITLSDGSKCFSVNYEKFDYSDCEAAIGPDGQLSYCPKCPYHRNKGIGYFEGENLYVERIEDTCAELEYVVNLYRKEKSGLEDINEILLKVISDSETYSLFLLEKELADGKKR